MSELFTQTDKQKKLFRTEEDIVANIQTQFGMPHTGKDLLLDAKMGPNKNQSSRLDSEPDALSDTGMSDDVGAGDTSGILHDSAGGNKKTIAGTNTPRASRASAYYDLLRSQHKNGHYKAPAYRVVDGQQPDPLCKRPSHEYQNLSPADHQTRRNGKLIYLQQAALHWQGRIFLEELCQKQFALAVWAKTVWPP